MSGDLSVATRPTLDALLQGARDGRLSQRGDTSLTWYRLGDDRVVLADVDVLLRYGILKMDLGQAGQNVRQISLAEPFCLNCVADRPALNPGEWHKVMGQWTHFALPPSSSRIGKEIYVNGTLYRKVES